jgi:hypothetical protein
MVPRDPRVGDIASLAETAFHGEGIAYRAPMWLRHGQPKVRRLALDLFN